MREAIKIQFILILKNGERITNTKLFNEYSEEDEVGCVVIFSDVPMIQDYKHYANKIAGFKQFEIDEPIKSFETKLL